MPLFIEGAAVSADRVLDPTEAALHHRSRELSLTPLRTVGKNALCVMQGECGFITSIPSEGPHIIGSADATNCLIALFWAHGTSFSVAGACHIDSVTRAQSLESELLQPMCQAWASSGAATNVGRPVWRVSLVGAYDPDEDAGVVLAVTSVLVSSTHEFRLDHACVLLNNFREISSVAVHDVCTHMGGAASDHSHADLDTEGIIGSPLIMHAAVDVKSGTVFSSDFSYLGPDVALRTARFASGGSSLSPVVDPVRQQWIVQPFECLLPAPVISQLLSISDDNELLGELSTSPHCEPPYFCERMRSALSLLKEHPLLIPSFFAEGPRCHPW